MKWIDLQDIQNRLGEDDQEALKALCDHYSQRLFQLAYAIVRSKETAEEVVEDVFIHVWQKRQRIGTVENLTFYLYVMAKNISRSYLRKFGRNKHIDLDELSLPFYQIGSSPEDLMISSEALQRINRAINELPPKCRIIFKLVKEDGLKYREVAELLHLSLKTVENQMGLALKKIHAAINSYLPQSIRLNR
ncbi:RNA polymerase sigma factor [Flavitalea flava]